MQYRNTNLLRRWLGCAALAGLSACSVGPVYQTPALEAPGAFGNSLPPANGAGPAASLDDWWTQFDDPLVAELVETARRSSPTLAAASARIEQARALAGSAGAARWPEVDLNASASRARSLPGPGATVSGSSTSKSLDASWELDLFGGLANARQAALSRLAARGADWQAARIALAAEVADTLTRYRACGLSADVLAEDVRSHDQTTELTRMKVKSGLTAPADGALSDAAAADARQRLAAQRAECAQDLAALVALTGVPDAALRARLAAARALPQPRAFVVQQLPAQVLAQRPDLAAAERDLAAASADINVAQAARYPKLTLLGSIGLAGVRLGGASGSGSTWSFGPGLSLPLFDAGRRAADVDAARARYDEQLALYRQLVRGAVQETEDALVRLDAAAQREDDASAAARDYGRYVSAGVDRFHAGTGSLFELEEARRNARAAELTLISVRAERVAAWIALYKAVGGGWRPAPAAIDPALAAATPMP